MNKADAITWYLLTGEKVLVTNYPNGPDGTFPLSEEQDD